MQVKAAQSEETLLHQGQMLFGQRFNLEEFNINVKTDLFKNKIKNAFISTIPILRVQNKKFVYIFQLNFPVEHGQRTDKSFQIRVFKIVEFGVKCDAEL